MSTTFKMHNGDLLLDATGTFATCAGIEKCSQDIAETLMNNFSPLDESYYIGSELYKLDFMTFSAGGMDAIMTIETFARDAVKRLMAMQENDQEVETDELLVEIQFLRAQKIGSLSYGFFMRCLTESELPAEVGFDISLRQQLPNSIANSASSFVPGTGSTR